ncbi:hypothetical protein [Salinispora arenicola]|uniref:hypothetical protein n=1 Tax=Salinispora arenicola TaxID=168697 RepID=UPI0027DCCA3C|nr:hypothetical protein [Salinispora arenicola]
MLVRADLGLVAEAPGPVAGTVAAALAATSAAVMTAMALAEALERAVAGQEVSRLVGPLALAAAGVTSPQRAAVAAGPRGDADRRDGETAAA